MQREAPRWKESRFATRRDHKPDGSAGTRPATRRPTLLKHVAGHEKKADPKRTGRKVLGEDA